MLRSRAAGRGPPPGRARGSRRKRDQQAADALGHQHVARAPARVRPRRAGRGARPRTPASAAARWGETGGLEQVRGDIGRALRRPRGRAQALVVGRPCRRLRRAPSRRLEDRHALARSAASVAAIADATTVLPTSVSVPVTNSPRSARLRGTRRGRRRLGGMRRAKLGGRDRRARCAGLACGGAELRRRPFELGRVVASPSPPAAAASCPRARSAGLIACANTPRCSARSQTATARRGVAERPAARSRVSPAGDREALLRRARRAASGHCGARARCGAGCSRTSSSAASAAGDDGRRGAGGEDQRAGGVHEVSRHRRRRSTRRRRRSRAPCRACRRSTSTSPSRPAAATLPRPPGPEHAGRVRLVHHHARVVAVARARRSARAARRRRPSRRRRR